MQENESIFEKLIPLVDEYMLVELKRKQLRMKGLSDNKYMDKLEDVSSDVQIEIHNTLWPKTNQ